MDQLTDWLIAHYGQEQMNPGLDRIRRVLQPLLPSFQNTKIITIAGTNGKGETSLRLSSFLKEKSHCVWTSPHIERITERFRNSHGEISISELQRLCYECHEIVQREKFKLSFYEFLFFVFCTWASRARPQYLLLEVGLGGRLDAVNVFDADLVLLPSISRDHQEILGARYDQILREKLGLLRKKTTLISFLHLNYLRGLTQEIVHTENCSLIDLEGMISLADFEFSKRNQVLACAAYLHLTGKTINQIELNNSLNNMLPLEHRGEVWKQNGEWLFFGSHNVDGMRKLIQFLRSENYNFSRPPFDAVILAMSRREESDLLAMLKMIKASGLGKVIVTTFPHPKAASSELMESLSFQEGLEFAEDIKSYCNKNPGGHFLFTGSYYFIGYIQSLFRGTK